MGNIQRLEFKGQNPNQGRTASWTFWLGVGDRKPLSLYISKRDETDLAPLMTNITAFEPIGHER